MTAVSASAIIERPGNATTDARDLRSGPDGALTVADEERPDQAFDQLRHYRAFEAIVEEIQGRIVSHRLVSGQRLPPERDLAAQFGVSRPTLREAFRVLESMGLIESRIGSGRYVAARTSDDAEPDASIGERALVPFVEFLLGIEPYLASLAAARADAGDLDSIRRTLETSAKSARHAAATDTNFHLAVTKAAHNVVAREVLHSERGALYWADLWVSVLPSSAERIADEHRTVYEAIVDHDPERARAAMTAHLSGAMERIRQASARRQSSPITDHPDPG
jgi:GntR family transcriptional repressor for pyruvate dehydrogenase complex